MDPDSITHEYARLINASFAGAPADMVRAMHLCRGNFHSSWAAEGGYEPVAEVMFNECDIDALLPRIRRRPLGRLRAVALPAQGQDRRARPGLDQARRARKQGRDQAPDRRGGEVRRLDQLALCPQCGFASTVHGNDITTEQQAAKIRLWSRWPRKSGARVSPSNWRLVLANPAEKEKRRPRGAALPRIVPFPLGRVRR